MPNFVGKFPCIIELSNNGIDITVHPENQPANEELAAFFATSGALTTVAITQVDTERDGLGSSLGPYQSVKFDLSA